MTDLGGLLGDRAFDAVLGGVSDGVTVQDHEGRLIYANPAAARLSGFESVPEMLAATPAEQFDRYTLLQEDGSPFSLDTLPGRRVLLGRSPDTVVLRYVVKRTGEERFSRVDATPIQGDDGAVRYVVNTFADVTDAKRTERWLRLLANAGSLLSASHDYEETLQAVAALAVPVLADWCAVDLLDESGRLQRVGLHHADPETMAIARTLMLGRGSASDESPGRRRVIRTGEPLLVVDLTGDEVDRISQREGWDADYRAVVERLGLRSVILAPLTGRERILGVLTLVYAESGRRYAERDLSIAELLARRAALAVENSLLYGETQQAIKARDRFLALAAHELLTPVTIVRGYTDAVQRSLQRAMDEDPDAATVSVDGPRVRRALSNLNQAATRLTRLVNDLLDVSRLQQGSLALSLEPLDLSALVASVLESIEVQRGEGRYSDAITLCADLPPDGQVVGSWDRLRIEQVLFNVLDNAMKYSPRGGEVRVRLSTHDGLAQVDVGDQGIGISAEHLSTIFEPFHRSPQAGEHAAGFGMGLAVCREIIGGHGGTITAESAGQGQGTTIRITLPGARLVAAPVTAADAPPTRAAAQR